MKWVSNHFCIDYRSLFFFRVLLGTFLFLDLISRFPNLSAQYSDRGFLTRSLRLSEISIEGLPQFSLYFFSDSVYFAGALLLVTAILSICLVFGWKTRLIVLLCWVLYASLIVRNPHIRDGGHNLLRVFLFWSILLPWPKDLSFRNCFVTGLRGRAVFSAATVGILLQVAIVYWMAAIWKYDPVWRETNQAVAQAFTIESLRTNFAEYLLNYPNLLSAATPMILLVEEFAPLLAILLACNSPWRGAVAIGMIFFHFSIWSLFYLGAFPFIAMMGWILFIPAGIWDCVALKAPLFRAATITGRGSALTNTISVVSLIFIFVWNISYLPFTTKRSLLPASIEKLGSILNLSQRWSFFAPSVLTRDGWYICEAELQGGSKIDLCNGGAAVNYDRPVNIRETYKDNSYRQYLTHIFHHKRGHLLAAYASWLESSWNGKYPENQVKNPVLVFMLYDGKFPHAKPKRVVVHPTDIDDFGVANFNAEFP